METSITKTEIEKMKSDIKQLSEKQRYYKNQRKTEHIVGERTMPAWEAIWKHQSNRHKLRILYAVYGLMNEKCFSQIENHYPEENHPLKKLQYGIDKEMIKYTTEEK